MDGTKTIVQELININQLLKEEVDKANFFVNKRAREILEPIYLLAAEKLIKNGLVSDESEVCAKLYKVFGTAHERHIREWLPEKYKRGYIQNEDRWQPRNLEEEAVKLMSDVLSDMFESVWILYKKIREEPQTSEKYKGLVKIVTEQFGGPTELQKRIQEWKDLSIELAHLKELQDERQKIGDYEKIMLKIQLLFINKDHVAKMIKLSSKWIKNGVERDAALEKALNKIRVCPKCLFDIADWYNVQRIRIDKGLPVQVPPVLEH